MRHPKSHQKNTQGAARKTRKAPATRTASERPRRTPEPTTRTGEAKASKSEAPKNDTPKGDRERVHDMLKGFSTVMLFTMEGRGEDMKHRARPMNVAKLDDDCTLTFVTGLDTSKVDEAARNDQAHVVAQGKTQFLSISGRTEISRDRAQIEAAWSPADKVFFPEGKDDPNLCLMIFHPEEAELWDVSGAKGLKFLFEAAKSLVTREKPYSHDKEQHDIVNLRAAE